MQYCVELIADRLETILENNPELYEIIDSQEDNLETLEILKESVTRAKVKMCHDIESITSHTYLNDKGEQELLCKFLPNLSNHLEKFQPLTDELLLLINRASHYHNQKNNHDLDKIFKEYLPSFLSILDDETITKILDSISLLERSYIERLELIIEKPEISVTDNSFFSSRKRSREEDSLEAGAFISASPTLIITQESLVSHPSF